MKFSRSRNATESQHRTRLNRRGERHLQPILAGILLSLLGAAAIQAAPEKLAAGAGRFEFTQAGKTVPVWYYVPSDAKPDAPVLIVMHGVKRDADRYRNEWMPHAQKY